MPRDRAAWARFALLALAYTALTTVLVACASWFDLPNGYATWYPPAAAMLQSAVPVQHAHEYFCDVTGQFSAGVWDTTGYHRKLIDFPRHELMHLLEGAVTFEDDQGHRRGLSPPAHERSASAIASDATPSSPVHIGTPEPSTAASNARSVT